MLQILGHIGFGVFGLAVLIAIAWAFSNNKRAVDWKLVATGVVRARAVPRLLEMAPVMGSRNAQC